MAMSLDAGHTPLNIELIKSTKAKNKAHIKGFLYTLNGVSSAGKQYWLCEKRGTCKARITTSPEGAVLIPSLFTEIINSHTHAPDPARFQMLQGYQLMKDRAFVSGEKTRNILTQGIVELNESSIAALPTLSSVKRTIRRHKSLVEENGINHDSVAELRIPDRYKYTLKEENFLIYDSGSGDSNRILIFSAPKMLSLLGESQSWYADGTFKVVPEQFYQLYTIHAEKDSMIIPCVYALLTNKSELTYKKLFTKLLDIHPELNPFLIMVDFEKATINALESTFLLSVVSGCFFHLSQNIYRKIQSAGFTKQYIENEGFALQMKMLPSLAFVPECQVIHYFSLLMEEFPTFAIEIAEYFEVTYIGRMLPNHTRKTPPFPIRIWNLYARANLELARTNNSVEGWHNGFQSGISCAHPSFTKLLRYIQLEQSLQEAILTKWESGEVIGQSKRSIARSKHILTIISDFGNREPISYLKGIAHNFNF